MTDEVLRLLRIRGRVQGVGYRVFVQEQAMGVGLRGWVRNRRDGSVEALVAGEEIVIERFVVLLRQGPPGARVDSIDAITAAPDALLDFRDDFVVLPTS